MTSGLVPLIVLPLLVAAVWYGAHRWRERQRARLRAIAAAHGLEVDVSTSRPPALGFDLFDEGSSRRLSARMWRPGEDDSVFQYQYTVRSGDSSRTYRFTGALVALPFRAPHLEISTETWWSRVKRAVGLRDIEVESPTFNERYQVRCNDDRFAITLLDPEMIAWMLSDGSGHGVVTFELRDRWLLCHCDQLDLESLPGMLTWAQTVRSRLPAVLTELYGV